MKNTTETGFDVVKYRKIPLIHPTYISPPTHEKVEQHGG